MSSEVIINIKTLFKQTATAKLSSLDTDIKKAQKLAGEGMK